MADTFRDNSPDHVGAYNRGAFARLRGNSLGMNPHDEGTGLCDAWRSGWNDENVNLRTMDRPAGFDAYTRTQKMMVLK